MTVSSKQSVNEVFIVSIKFYSSQAMLYRSEFSLGGIVSHENTPCRPVQVADGQPFQHILFNPWIRLRIKFSVLTHFIHCKPFLNPKLGKLLHLIVNRTLIKEVSDVVIYIIV